MEEARRSFDFGENWRGFASTALNEERVNQARKDFNELTKDLELPGKRFLDIGFGQGLAAYLAAEKNAQVSAIDIAPASLEAARLTGGLFSVDTQPEFEIASILDTHWLESPRRSGGYDIVHSWGVLHHTGQMYKAIENAADLVKPGGFLILALYNNHWTAPIWKLVKRIYVNAPSIVRAALISLFYLPLYCGVWCFTGRSPASSPRGMDFYYDLVDWIGGYPYEFANSQEIENFLLEKGFIKLKHIPPQVPTGNNQWVFHKQTSN